MLKKDDLEEHDMKMTGSCPNCGSTDFAINFGFGEFNEARIRCEDCGTSGKVKFIPYFTEKVRWD